MLHSSGTERSNRPKTPETLNHESGWEASFGTGFWSSWQGDVEDREEYESSFFGVGSYSSESLHEMAQELSVPNCLSVCLSACWATSRSWDQNTVASLYEPSESNYECNIEKNGMKL